MGQWKRQTKSKKTKRQNLPKWRKVRGWGKKMVRMRRGTRLDNIKIKTKEWEKVE